MATYQQYQNTVQAVADAFKNGGKPTALNWQQLLWLSMAGTDTPENTSALYDEIKSLCEDTIGLKTGAIVTNAMLQEFFQYFTLYDKYPSIIATNAHYMQAKKLLDGSYFKDGTGVPLAQHFSILRTLNEVNNTQIDFAITKYAIKNYSTISKVTCILNIQSFENTYYIYDTGSDYLDLSTSDQYYAAIELVGSAITLLSNVTIHIYLTNAKFANGTRTLYTYDGLNSAVLNVGANRQNADCTLENVPWLDFLDSSTAYKQFIIN